MGVPCNAKHQPSSMHDQAISDSTFVAVLRLPDDLARLQSLDCFLRGKMGDVFQMGLLFVCGLISNSGECNSPLRSPLAYPSRKKRVVNCCSRTNSNYYNRILLGKAKCTLKRKSVFLKSIGIE